MSFKMINKKGQSLVEVVVACAILGITMAAIMSMVISSKNLLYQSEAQTEATTLAQEGIGIVQHQRDIGCSFSNITTNGVLNGANGGSDFVVKGDLLNETGEDLVAGSITSATNIDGNGKTTQFVGFERGIEIQELSALASNQVVTGSGFQASGINYDIIDDYYYITVTVNGPNNAKSEISTIISKK